MPVIMIEVLALSTILMAERSKAPVDIPLGVLPPGFEPRKRRHLLFRYEQNDCNVKFDKSFSYSNTF